MEMKFCKHCGQSIDADCVICPKCGKQVEEIKSAKDSPIIINNSASSSASAAAAAAGGGRRYVKMPWYIRWFWIFVLGLITGGIYWIVGFILRHSWLSQHS